jgi:hypothetical protein
MTLAKMVEKAEEGQTQAKQRLKMRESGNFFFTKRRRLVVGREKKKPVPINVYTTPGFELKTSKT